MLLGRLWLTPKLMDDGRRGERPRLTERVGQLAGESEACRILTKGLIRMAEHPNAPSTYGQGADAGIGTAMAKSVVGMDSGIVRRDDPLQARSTRLNFAEELQGIAKRSVCREIETGVLSTLGYVDELLGEAARGVELGSHIVKVPESMQRRKTPWRVAQLLAQLQRSTIC